MCRVASCASRSRWRHAFAPLVDAGGLQILTGDADVGARLCTHPAVDALHLTGSHHTYESVVFGPGPAGAAGPGDVERPATGRLDEPGEEQDSERSVARGGVLHG